MSRRSQLFERGTLPRGRRPRLANARFGKRGERSPAASGPVMSAATNVVQFRAVRCKPKSVRRRKPRGRSESRLKWLQAFGARLRATRLTLDVSEAGAAAACLLTLRTYRRREAGLPYRGWHDGLVSFVQKYGLSYDWLLAGDGPMVRHEAPSAASEQPQARPRLKLELVSDKASPPIDSP
jgi:hypothetical protein